MYHISQFPHRHYSQFSYSHITLKGGVPIATVFIVCFWVGLVLILSGSIHGHGLVGHLHVGEGMLGGRAFSRFFR